MLPRRKYLLIGTSAMLGAAAGCLDDSSDQDEGGTPPPDIDDDDDDRPPRPDPIDSPVESQDILPAHREQIEAESNIEQSGRIEIEVESDSSFEDYEVRGSRYTITDNESWRVYESNSTWTNFQTITIQTPSGDTYTRINDDGSISYPEPECDSVSDTNLNQPAFDEFGEFLNSVAYTHRGTEWTGDYWISEYAADSVELVDDEFAEAFVGDEIVSFSTRITIAGDGLINEFSLTFETASQGTGEYAYEVSYRRQGAVSEPDWLSEAEIAVDDPSC